MLFSTFITLFFASRSLTLIMKADDEYFQSNVYYHPDENYIQLANQKLDIHASFVGSGNATNFD